MPSSYLPRCGSDLVIRKVGDLRGSGYDWGGIAVGLRTLTTRRLGVVFGRTRQIDRLRAQLTEVLPALERSLDLVNEGPVMLLTGHRPPATGHRLPATGYRPPAAIRRAGAERIGPG